MEQFINSIAKAPTDVAVALKRSFGKGTYPAHVRIYVEGVLPESLKNANREIIYLIAALICLQGDTSGENFPKLIATKYMGSKDSPKTMYKMVLVLLDNLHGVNGAYIKTLATMLKRMHSDEHPVDALQLLKDLVYWGPSVKHSWETIIATNCDKSFIEREK